METYPKTQEILPTHCKWGLCCWNGAMLFFVVFFFFACSLEKISQLSVSLWLNKSQALPSPSSHICWERKPRFANRLHRCSWRVNTSSEKTKSNQDSSWVVTKPSSLVFHLLFTLSIITSLISSQIWFFRISICSLNCLFDICALDLFDFSLHP